MTNDYTSKYRYGQLTINVCSVTWPFNGSEAAIQRPGRQVTTIKSLRGVLKR